MSNKICWNIVSGPLGSHGYVRDGRFKQHEIQRSPTAEELFEASSLFEADDEITG